MKFFDRLLGMEYIEKDEEVNEFRVEKELVSVTNDFENEKENIDENNGKILIKDRSDCNHVQNVYRLNIGDELRVIDGEYEYFTKIAEISKKEIAVKILEKKDKN